MAKLIAAYAAQHAKAKLEPFQIERREVGPLDVQLAIEYCGVCHTDLHFVNNDWGISNYPVVPGHEIIGKVTAVGADVTKFQVGDRAAVGVRVGSCGSCLACARDREQHCLVAKTSTYNTPTQDPGGFTFGGYSRSIVTTERFTFTVPDNLPSAAAAPLLCAGITTYSPLNHWNAGAGTRVGVVGLGGLGHLGVKIASAMGAHTVMITTSPHKAADAQRLGAHEVLLSTDAAAMRAAAGSFDLILNTIPVSHDLNPYLDLLRFDGVLSLVGALEPLPEINAAKMVFGSKTLSASVIGGLKETQEMLDFCGKHHIVSDVEIIRMDQINEAYERLVKNDVKYRFVIDMSTLS